LGTRVRCHARPFLSATRNEIEEFRGHLAFYDPKLSMTSPRFRQPSLKLNVVPDPTKPWPH
jgi:hypothetical protein